MSNWETRLQGYNTRSGKAGFHKSETPILDKRITTFYTQSERNEIGDFCKKKGISMNEFTRSAIAQYLKSNS